MFGGLPHDVCHITSGLSGEEGVEVPMGTTQTMSVHADSPRTREVYNTICHRIRVSVPCAKVVRIVRYINTELYVRFRQTAQDGSLYHTLMGFTSSPCVLVPANDFEPRFIATKEHKRRRTDANTQLIPSAEPGIYAAPHAIVPLFIHTGEREKDGSMVIAFGEYAIPSGDTIPHWMDMPTPNPTQGFDNKFGSRKVLGSLDRNIFRGQYLLTNHDLFYAHYIIQVAFPQAHFGMDIQLSHCRTNTHLETLDNLWATPPNPLEDEQLGLELNAYNPQPFAQASYANAGEWKRKCLCASHSPAGEWFRIVRPTVTAQQNRDVVRCGDIFRLQHTETGHFLGCVDAESQVPLEFDQTSDERQRHVCLLPCVYLPDWKANRINWIASWGNSYDSVPLCFFPSVKAEIYLTNQATKLKLHSHDLPLFGIDALEVTAFHVANDVNNAWAISGIRMGTVSDPFLRVALSEDQLPFVGHPSLESDQEIVERERTFEAARQARKLRFLQAFDAQATLPS